MKTLPIETITLENIAGGGQTIGTLSDGRKVFVWGGVPGEKVSVQLTKSKKSYAEGVVVEVLEASAEREIPRDPESYLSTSPWQIYSFDAEQRYKAQLIREAFALHHIGLPGEVTVATDNKVYQYRNKVEFSFYWDNDQNQLELAFFARGSKGKIPVSGTSLAMPAINQAARDILQILRHPGIEARNLKTLLIRANQTGDVTAQLYIKDKKIMRAIEVNKLEALSLKSIELIHSDYHSPASIITERLQTIGEPGLQDTILEQPFYYATESFFQGNVPVYEMALQDMAQWIPKSTPVVDMFSGVGSIGLTIGWDAPTLVELNKFAAAEAERNIALQHSKAKVIQASAETSLEYITSDATIILDPPRAGLHKDVVDRLLEVKPARVIYLSCNPVTQARDVQLLESVYKIEHHQGYNFFPRTPHIEHLVVLNLK